MSCRCSSAFLFGLLALIGGAGRLAAHPSLYHHVEVNLHDPAFVRIYITVHGPDLPTAVAAGIDPTDVSEEWLMSSTEADLSALLDEADQFVRGTFRFGVVEHGDAPIRFLAGDALPFVYETPAQIRDPAYDNGLPSGCFLAAIEFPNPGHPRGLAVNFSAKAEKRLTLAISRPAAFPEVRDLDAGESTQFELHEAPPRDITGLVVSAAAAVLAVVALLLWLAMRRRLAR